MKKILELAVMIGLVGVAVIAVRGAISIWPTLREHDQLQAESRAALAQLHDYAEEHGDGLVVERFELQATAYRDHWVGVRFIDPWTRESIAVRVSDFGAVKAEIGTFIGTGSPSLSRDLVFIEREILGDDFVQFWGRGRMKVLDNHVYVGSAGGNWRELCQLDMVEVNNVDGGELDPGQGYEFWGNILHTPDGRLCWHVNVSATN